MSLFQAILNVDDISAIKSGTATKLKDFATLIMKLQEAQPKYQLPEFLGLVLERTGYLRELQSTGTDEDLARIENLQELVNVANEFEPEELDNVLGEFLVQVSLVSDIDGMDEIANNVTLMTLHASKGLEFPIVYLAGCDEGIFPSARTMMIKSELEEERRLMYVGITRAEQKLYLTTAKRRQMWGEYKYYTPSRFIEEIPCNLLESEKSYVSEYSSRSTFSDAVKSVKNYNYDKPKNNYSDSQISSGTGFGKNFVAPGREKYNIPSEPKKITNVVKQGPKRAFINKNPINKQREEEKVKAFFEDNIMKRRLEEHKKEQAKIEAEKVLAEEVKNSATQYYFNVGERVFHDKLGVGHITDVIQIGESTMYTIDFGKMGKKAMDAAYAHLKKF
jgi:DNA helicase-2/ATP-dependent DNA helicase PcrA